MRNLLLALACSLAYAATAQPTWRFHLAFEDGTGARDTIWFVFDTTATSTTWVVDDQLGEAAVQMNLDSFNVWILNPAYDSTKTIAVPYYQYFPYSSAEIQAFNYTYPITLRWDSALFHAPGLPPPGYFPGAHMQSNYFFGVPEYHVFDMTSTNVVTAPIDLFPLLVNIGFPNTAGLAEHNSGPLFSFFPNPARDRLFIHAPPIRGDVSLFDLSGRMHLHTPISDSRVDLDVSGLEPGVYLLQLRNNAGDIMTRWFIKL